MKLRAHNNNCRTTLGHYSDSVSGTAVLICAISTVLCTSIPLRAQPICKQGFPSYCDYRFAFGETVRSPSVGIDDQGRFVLAWQEQGPGMFPPPESNILVQRLSAGASAIGSAFYLAERNVNCTADEHTDPSLAMNRAGDVHVAWLSECNTGQIHQPCCSDPQPCVCSWSNRRVLHAVFPYSSPPSTTGAGNLLGDYTFDSNPSAGLGSAGAPSGWTRTWQTNLAPCPPNTIVGMLRDPPSSVLRSCDGCSAQPVTYCFLDDWAPCVSARTDSKFAVAWADPETPTRLDSKFNIYARIFDASGAPLTTDVYVNDPAAQPAPEIFPSSQKWPYVSFDDAGNLVVVWVGPQLDPCASHQPGFRIFARRFKFVQQESQYIVRDPLPGEGRAGGFIVDSSPNVAGDTRPLDPQDAHPSVALTLDPNNAGAFIAAWNAIGPTNDTEIRGQYFDRLGRPKGTEFRLNVDNSPLTPGAPNGVRMMALGARHTLAYGKQDQVLVTFRHGYATTTEPQDYLAFTYVPPGYSDVLLQQPQCCKGDVDGNGLVNGRDIAPFIRFLLNPRDPLFACRSYAEVFCEADINRDGIVDMLDVPPFVAALLQGPGCASALLELLDCNGNGANDANDIASGYSQDCNHNFVPDECDLANGTSHDVNGNSIPDECEPDCNGNHVPDAWDISHGGKADVDGNGVPDECEKDCNHNNVPDSYDISQHTSADCNLNGTPDECESDCNQNGVPDDCDIDPTDPDGNGLVSLDCNHNGYPDECDLTLFPPVGSLDCNANGIPDECDIASGYSQDTNGNHIPDECEGGGQNAMSPTGSGARGTGSADDAAVSDDDSAGGAGEMNTSQSAPDQGAAWEEFYVWAWERCWGPDCLQSVVEQFQDYVDKLTELGLPVVGPRHGP